MTAHRRRLELGLRSAIRSAPAGLSHASRGLRRAPAFSLAVILTLTIGIGSSTAIFGVVNAILLRPLPYPNPDRLVAIVNDMPSLSMAHLGETVGIYLAYQRYSRTLQRVALYQQGSANVADVDGRSDPVRLNVAYATASLVPVLGTSPIRGRFYSDAEDVARGPNVVVISERLWRTRFGSDPHITSRAITLGSERSDIVGVMPASFGFPGAEVDLWVPLRIDPNVPQGGFSYDAVARLAPTASPQAAARELAELLPRAAEITPTLTPNGMAMTTVLAQAKPIPRVLPLRDEVVGGAAGTLRVVAAGALLVLLVTCANATNLYLIRADSRRRDLAVRTALGAGRTRILSNFLTESAVLALVALALAVLLAAALLHYLVTHGATELPRLAEVHLGGVVVGFAVLTSAIVAVICGAIAARHGLGGDLLSSLRESTRGGSLGGRRQRTRSALVAGQVALAVVALAASALLMRSFKLLHAVRPGYDPRGVAELWVSLPAARYPTDSDVVRFSVRLRDAMSHVVGVEEASVSSDLPFVNGGVNVNPFYVEGDESNTKTIPPVNLVIAVDSAYFSTLRVPFIAGHNFASLDEQRADEAVVTREAARLFFHDSTGREAINKRFRETPTGPWHTVIGVVDDVRDTSLAGGPTRMVFLPMTAAGDPDQTTRTLGVAARTRGDAAAETREMIKTLRTLDPTLPAFQVQSMDATVAASTAQLSFTIIILGVAAAVTLVLGMIGLYGVTAYVVALRTRELGLRIALGAQPRSIGWMITARGLMLASGGIVAGLIIVIISGRFMRSLLFDVGPTDPIALAASAGLLLMCTGLSCWLPAARAARVDPMLALRGD